MKFLLLGVWEISILRIHIINFLKDRLPYLKFGSAPKRSHRIYNQSLINLNISLNGDLNWRFLRLLLRVDSFLPIVYVRILASIFCLMRSSL